MSGRKPWGKSDKSKSPSVKATNNSKTLVLNIGSSPGHISFLLGGSLTNELSKGTGVGNLISNKFDLSSSVAPSNSLLTDNAFGKSPEPSSNSLLNQTPSHHSNAALSKKQGQVFRPEESKETQVIIGFEVYPGGARRP